MPFTHQIQENNKLITQEQIISARNECARIISVYGEKYLPIFERLEKEIAKREQQNQLLKKALKIGTQNGTQIKIEFSNASN